MGVQDIVVVAIVGAAAWYAIRFLWRAMSGAGGTCKCGPGPKSCGAGAKDESSTRPTFRPFVPTDQVGKPPSDQQRG